MSEAAQGTQTAQDAREGQGRDEGAPVGAPIASLALVGETGPGEKSDGLSSKMRLTRASNSECSSITRRRYTRKWYLA
jgi:hypothetical protein